MKYGYLQVITGSMFSGKTTELLRLLRRYEFAGKRVVLCKPKTDDRYSPTHAVTHDNTGEVAIVVESAADIITHVDMENVDVVGIDEAQFFDEALVSVCLRFLEQGIIVVVAGLDMDRNQQPFGCIPELLCRAKYITKLHAVCAGCSADACYSYMSVDVKSADQVHLGGAEAYQALCENCYPR